LFYRKRKDERIDMLIRTTIWRKTFLGFDMSRLRGLKLVVNVVAIEVIVATVVEDRIEKEGMFQEISFLLYGK
jgi:hypothetical protein